MKLGQVRFLLRMFWEEMPTPLGASQCLIVSRHDIAVSWSPAMRSARPIAQQFLLGL